MRVLLILLLASPVYAETFIFRQQVTPATKHLVEAFYSDKGKQDKRQPFFGTYILTQPNPDYLLIKITPKDEAEYQLLKTKYGQVGVDLYQRYEITDNGIEMLEDNSEQFPVYEVKESSK